MQLVIPRTTLALASLALALAVALGPGCDGDVPAGRTSAGVDPELERRLAAVPTATPARLALLVGIDRYAGVSGGRLSDLEGAVNDVRRLARTLVDRFEFAPEDILVLEDEAATHAAVVTAFQRFLVERAGPDTDVLFWFSGHGSRVPDESGESLAEEGALDSTLVCYDSRADGADGSYDLVDDELHGLLLALCERTRRVAVVTDACHSAAITRSGEVAPSARVRAAPPGTEPFDPARVRGFWPEGLALLDDGAIELSRGEYVHVAACGQSQVAHEVELDDAEGPRAHGAFSYSFLRLLERARPGDTWRHLAEDAGLEVRRLYPNQRVRGDGALDRELFGARFRDAPDGFPVEPRSDGALLVYAGALHGLRAGSVLGLFDARTSERVGEAVVDAVGEISARATPRGAVAARGALRAVEESRPARLEPLPIWFEDPALGERVAQVFEGLEVTQRDRARYLVLGGGAGGGLRLTTRGGLCFWREGPESARRPSADERLADAAAGIARELDEEVRWLALDALAFLPGELEVTADFEPPNATDLQRWGRQFGACRPARFEATPDAGVVRATADPSLRSAMLVVRNPADHPVHVGVVSIAEDRSYTVIWPIDATTPTEVAPGEAFRVPLMLVLDERWPRDRPMLDRYLVLATRGPSELHRVRPRRSRLRAAESPAEGSDWSSLVRLALSEPTRGAVEDVGLDPARVGVLVRDVLVSWPE